VQCRECGDRYVKGTMRSYNCNNCRNTRNTRNTRCRTCDSVRTGYGYQCDLSSRCSSCGTRYADRTAYDCGKVRCRSCDPCRTKVQKPRRQYQCDTQCDTVRCKSCGVYYQQGTDHRCRTTTDNCGSGCGTSQDAPRTAWHGWFKYEGNPL
jgi:hypothetical protein